MFYKDKHVPNKIVLSLPKIDSNEKAGCFTASGFPSINPNKTIKENSK